MAGVAELVDAADSKSAARKSVGVQARTAAAAAARNAPMGERTHRARDSSLPASNL
jgi:hypothetical protein